MSGEDHLRVDSVAPDEARPELLAAWRDLAAEVADATVFMWPFAFLAWRRTLGEGVPTEILVARRGERLAGVLPVMRTNVWRGPAFVPRIDYGPFDRDLAGGGRRPFPVRQISSVASWRAACLRPTLLCRPQDRAEVAHAVALRLGRAPGVDQIVLPVRDGEEAPWLDGLQEAGLRPWVHRLGRQVLTLEHVRPIDDILRDQSANFRRNIRRARAAADAAGLAFRVLVGRDHVRSNMDLLARLAAESWKGKSDAGRIAIPYAGGQQSFFQALLAEPDPGIQPVLCLGETGDGPQFAALTIRHGETLSGLLTFRRESLDAASPGLLGKATLVDWCAANGVTRFDLNTTQDWLRHLSDTTHELVNVVAFRRTPAGLLYEPVARWRRGALDRGSPLSG